MRLVGIDVSRWQGDVDWGKVKASGVDFAILKCGGSDDAGGPYVDRCFEMNYVRAKAAGVNVGVYWFTDAKTRGEAIRDAEYCLSIIKGKQLEYPIFFDYERNLGLGITAISDICDKFCARIEEAGYFAGIYASKAHLLSCMTKSIRDRYAIWVAQYYHECTYEGQYGIWQYSSEGTIDGIAGKVDLDICYIDYPKIIKEKQLNGFKVEPAPEEEEDDEAHARFLPVIKKGGDNPKEVKALQALLIAKFGYSCGSCGIDGKFGAETERALKEFQTKHHMKVTGECGYIDWVGLITM